MPKSRAKKSRWDRKLPWKHPVWQTEPEPEPPDWLQAYQGDIAYARKLTYRKPTTATRMLSRTVYEAALGEGYEDRLYELSELEAKHEQEERSHP